MKTDKQDSVYIFIAYKNMMNIYTYTVMFMSKLIS